MTRLQAMVLFSVFIFAVTAGTGCDLEEPVPQAEERRAEEQGGEKEKAEAPAGRTPQPSLQAASKEPEGQKEPPASKEEPAAAEKKEPQWSPPRFEERRAERHRMVERQIASRDVDSERVVEAMRHVPRHLFVPQARRSAAYRHTALPIGHGQTISQPYIVAIMTQLLRVEPGDRVLEIGTGSGYQAAVLSELTPEVYSIEILESLAGRASRRLDRLGYTVVETKQGDGYYGWEQHAPFDGIIVTCAAGHIPPPLVEQLRPGGRMVIPVGSPAYVQWLTVVTKKESGELRTRNVMGVRFVPMTGKIREGGD